MRTHPSNTTLILDSIHHPSWRSFILVFAEFPHLQHSGRRHPRLPRLPRPCRSLPSPSRLPSPFPSPWRPAAITIRVTICDQFVRQPMVLVASLIHLSGIGSLIVCVSRCLFGARPGVYISIHLLRGMFERGLVLTVFIFPLFFFCFFPRGRGI